MDNRGPDNRGEVREFLTSRRGRISPERSGLPIVGGNRRVTGLRREEVAMLAEVSTDYYTRLERGNLTGISETARSASVRADPRCSTCSTCQPRRVTTWTATATAPEAVQTCARTARPHPKA
jgi:Helix-turn-helix domain